MAEFHLARVSPPWYCAGWLTVTLSLLAGKAEQNAAIVNVTPRLDYQLGKVGNHLRGPDPQGPQSPRVAVSTKREGKKHSERNCLFEGQSHLQNRLKNSKWRFNVLINPLYATCTAPAQLTES